jgi:hypothetical protein
LIESSLDGTEVDLLAKPDQANSIKDQLSVDAKVLFRQQVNKAGLDMARILQAQLTIEKMEELVEWVWIRNRFGARFSFTVRVQDDLGKMYEMAQSVFIAPHDPDLDRRRGGF